LDLALSDGLASLAFLEGEQRKKRSFRAFTMRRGEGRRRRRRGKAGDGLF
jgi:hypothetical protein